MYIVYIYMYVMFLEVGYVYCIYIYVMFLEVAGVSRVRRDPMFQGSSSTSCAEQERLRRASPKANFFNV